MTKCRWCAYDASDLPTKRAEYYVKVHEEVLHPTEKYDADVVGQTAQSKRYL